MLLVSLVTGYLKRCSYVIDSEENCMYGKWYPFVMGDIEAGLAGKLRLAFFLPY